MSLKVILLLFLLFCKEWQGNGCYQEFRSKISNQQNGKETVVMKNSDSKINNKQNGKETGVKKKSESKINIK